MLTKILANTPIAVAVYSTEEGLLRSKELFTKEEAQAIVDYKDADVGHSPVIIIYGQNLKAEDHT